MRRAEKVNRKVKEASQVRLYKRNKKEGKENQKEEARVSRNRRKLRLNLVEEDLK